MKRREGARPPPGIAGLPIRLVQAFHAGDDGIRSLSANVTIEQVQTTVSLVSRHSAQIPASVKFS
jgi:hypothetical protein